MALKIIRNLDGANTGAALRKLRHATKTEDMNLRGEYIRNGVFPALHRHLSSNDQRKVADAAMICSFLLYKNQPAVKAAMDANILNALIPLLSCNVFDAKRGASNALNDFTNESGVIASVVGVGAVNPLIAILEQHKEDNLLEGAAMNLMNILLEGANLQRNTEKNTFKSKFDEVNAAARFLALFKNNAKSALVRKIVSFCLCLLYASTKLPAEYLPVVEHVKTFIGSQGSSDSHYACFALSNLVENSANKLVIVNIAFVTRIINILKTAPTYIVGNNCLLLRNVCAPGLSSELKGFLKGCGIEAALQPLKNHREDNIKREVDMIFYYLG